jgi:uncharacterized membrane protein
MTDIAILLITLGVLGAYVGIYDLRRRIRNLEK